MIKHWHYIITGFQQHRGTATRLQLLWRDLHRSMAGPDTVVNAAAWNSDWSSEAEHVYRHSRQPTVCIYAYSWGAGWGFTRFAKELNSRGINVRHAVLIDPVYRSPLWLIGQWRALIPSWPITIPSNVDRVSSFRQRINHPRGHDLVASSSRTIVDPPRELQVPHDQMDDSLEVNLACLTVAAALTADPTGPPTPPRGGSFPGRPPGGAPPGHR